MKSLHFTTFSMLLEIRKEDAIQELTQSKEFIIIAFAFVFVFQIIAGKLT